MPTYEYECLDKGHRFEEFQSISEDPVDVCPVCGSKAKRVISAGAGFLFKGSGFHQTDYRSDSYRKGEKAEKGEGGKSGGESKESGSSGSGGNGSSGGEG
jgi:putative FmdB family regulatory protein